MKNYIVTLGRGIQRNVIAAHAFAAIRTALGTLSISEQAQVIVRNMRIKAEPARRLA